MRMKIKTATTRTGNAAAGAARAIGLMLGAYIGGTVALALFAATYEPRFGAAVVGVACLAFYLLDLAMLRRRPRT